MSIVKADRDVDCHVARTCLRSFWQHDEGNRRHWLHAWCIFTCFSVFKFSQGCWAALAPSAMVSNVALALLRSHCFFFFLKKFLGAVGRRDAPCPKKESKPNLTITEWRRCLKRSIEHSLRMKNFEARYGNYERNAVVKNQGTKKREQSSLGDSWQWESNGQCSNGDNCSFRHDKDQRAKSTQPNSSPSSSTRQNEGNASGTKSPRGTSSSGKMARLLCKDYLKGTCTTPFCEKVAPSRVLVPQDRKWMHIRW